MWATTVLATSRLSIPTRLSLAARPSQVILALARPASGGASASIHSYRRNPMRAERGDGWLWFDSFARTPRLNFTLVRTRNNGAWSTYHGVQNELKIRVFHGLTADVAYTFSKALDNTSEVFASTGGKLDAYLRESFQSQCGGARHFGGVITRTWSPRTGYMTSLWASKQRGIFGHVLGGWQISGTHVTNPVLSSLQPRTPTMAILTAMAVSTTTSSGYTGLLPPDS